MYIKALYKRMVIY